MFVWLSLIAACAWAKSHSPTSSLSMPTFPPSSPPTLTVIPEVLSVSTVKPSVGTTTLYLVNLKSLAQYWNISLVNISNSNISATFNYDGRPYGVVKSYKSVSPVLSVASAGIRTGVYSSVWLVQASTEKIGLPNASFISTQISALITIYADVEFSKTYAVWECYGVHYTPIAGYEWCFEVYVQDSDGFEIDSDPDITLTITMIWKGQESSNSRRSLTTSSEEESYTVCASSWTSNHYLVVCSVPMSWGGYWNVSIANEEDYIVYEKEVLCPSGCFENENGNCQTCRGQRLDGASCDGEGNKLATLTLDKGYWRAAADSKSILSCTDKSFDGMCKGGNKSYYGECRKGHHGAYCSVCKSDYYKSTTSLYCKKCSQSEMFDFFLTIGLAR
ncbi:hypothetical protein CTAYLR_009928 [Chrysophaeum taylorii]|uniref:Uncharacterized protein n=1 Tax=Chrysophaeum taylorii TaxID=2483200 RepID=A0AAD7UKC1_9STRA|nr:hypothetical protein CTAYLR_009928 [Chrysophaeum taylorii]